MEPESSFPCSQDPATVPHNEPEKFSPKLPALFVKDP
jgi:hypothetical protein